MTYKDSFVDEYPYLIYSDDPEAAGGEGGSDIGIPSDETLAMLSNASSTGITDTPILVDAEGEKTIAAISIADSGSILIAPNAYIGLSDDFYIYVGDLDAGHTLDPAGEFTVGEMHFKTYLLSDPDETYSILAS